MGTNEWLVLIGSIVLLIISIAAVIFSVKSKKHIDKALSAGLAEVSEFRASVKELRKTEDGKFCVLFENENGEEISVFVAEDVFGEFAEKESGILTLSDGELLSFVIDEEI